MFYFLLTTPTIPLKLDTVLKLELKWLEEFNLQLSVYLIIEMARGVTSLYLLIIYDGTYYVMVLSVHPCVCPSGVI
jgi:hypothetical protein